MTSAVTVPLLQPDQLSQLADLVADRLLERLGNPMSPMGDTPRLVDADTLARMFSVGRSTIYEHAAELGAVQLGDGKRALVRFDIERARAAWTARDVSKQSQVADPPAPGEHVRRRRTTAARDGVELLPVGGQEAA